MSPGLFTVPTVAAAAVAVLLVVLLAAVVGARRARRRTEAALAASRAELAEVQQRLDALTEQLSRPAPPEPRHRVDETEYVITTAGELRTPESAVPQVDARQFASLAVGESLVRLLSLGYGVRRALSAENRNRIAFEMRREVRRSRKDRRRELRDLRRRLREEPGLAEEHAA
jgi:hypothetical protein